MSPSGGARALFHLGEAGVFKIVMGKTVLEEAEEVIRRKIPNRLTDLAQLLNEARVEIVENPSAKHTQTANTLTTYMPDALVLAEALQAMPDWFITHDREHFLNNPALQRLPFRIGNPGDVLQWQREQI
jgi:predicted nucleic acid-binding protein